MRDRNDVLAGINDIDLERIPIEELFEVLKCSTEGLTTEAAEERLANFGQNKIEEKKENKILKFLSFLWNPMSWVMEAAAIMAIALAHGEGKPPDWQVCVGIMTLLLINSTINFVEEHNVDNVDAALKAQLAPKAMVLRDGRWSAQEAAVLVPGDIIRIKLGAIIPADARLLGGDPIMIDQSALTGEFLDVTKGPSDLVYSASTCKQGEIEAVVIATGVRTFFKKTACLLDSNRQVGHFQQVLTAVANFCIYAVAVAMIIEILVMYPIQDRKYLPGIDNLLVLLIGGIPIAMPTVLSVTMAIGSQKLSQQGVIMKRMPAIELMAGMDMLCCDRAGILTLNRVHIDKNLIEVFANGVDVETIVLMAARASKIDNDDAIDTGVIRMFDDPKEARVGIQEVHFLSFNPANKLTALTYVDTEGKMHRVCKGAPEQVLNLIDNKSDIEQRVYSVIGKFSERESGSLAVAYQEVPEGRKESAGGPWQFIGIMPLFYPVRYDSAEGIHRAWTFGVNVKIITGNQLALGQQTGWRLGIGSNLYSASVLQGYESVAALATDELLEKADGFAGVSPENKIEVVKQLQARKHICGVTGSRIGDIPALKNADIGIAFYFASDAARSASDIVITEPGLSAIVYAVITSREIFQRMKHYTLGFMLLALIWQFDFPPFMMLVIAILNDGTVMTIPRDRVRPSPKPDHWKLRQIFKTGFLFGSYLAMTTVIFFWTAFKTDFFPRVFGVSTLEKTAHKDFRKLASAVFLQVSTISQALIFVTRSCNWSYVERPKLLLMVAFLISQLIATLIAVYANWSFAEIEGIGWGWAGVIWLYNIVFYIPLDFIKFFIHYALSGRAWDLFMEQRIAFARQKGAGKEQLGFRLAPGHGTWHHLQPPDTMVTERNHVSEQTHFPEQAHFTEVNQIVVEAKRKAEIARLRELHTLKAHVESVLRVKGIDMDTIEQAYTV